MPAIYHIQTEADGKVGVGASGAGTCECGRSIRRSVDGVLYERSPGDVGSFHSGGGKRYRRHECPDGGNGHGPTETERVWSDTDDETDTA